MSAIAMAGTGYRQLIEAGLLDMALDELQHLADELLE